jgi:hypothetical protein
MEAERDWRWAAGYFEGEGHVSFIEGRRLRLMIGSCDPWPLEKFLKIAGMGKIYGPYPVKNKPNNQPVYRYEVGTAARVIPIVTRMYPHLSPRRREKILRMLVEYKEFKEAA